jgi:hypothetical protein
MQLAEQCRLLQEISHSQRLITASIGGSDIPCNRAAGLISTSDDADDRDPQPVDFVLGCVRRFSEHGALSSIDSLNALCPGSPDYCFESSASFFPEQYTVKNLFSMLICVNAMIQSPEDHLRKRLFITFLEKPRRWRRVIITANLHTLRKSSAMRQLVLPGDIQPYVSRTLPKAFLRLLNDTLSNVQLIHSVTSFSMSLGETESGQLISEWRSIPVKDPLEAEISNEAQKVQDLRDMGCAVISESEVTEQSSLSPTCYRVWCRSQTCLEEKVPFATSRPRDSNQFDAFFSDMRLIKSLHGCRGIPKFIGAVLDEHKLQLKGFLYEPPVLYSLEKLFYMAKFRSEVVPWSFREFWARELIQAVSSVHERGLHIGAIDLGRTGLKADGTPLLTRLAPSGGGEDMDNRWGHMAPELRKDYETNGRIPRNATNFRTDIFRLGYMLWLLAEHIAKPISYFCVRSACTNIPRYRCDAEHKNPVHLPTCNNVPAYFNSIIDACRSPDPNDRPTAQELAAMFPHTKNPEVIPSGLKELVQAYSTHEYEVDIYCDECNEHTTDLHYHCNICHDGDFDICPVCFNQGIRCYISEHRMLKRIRRNGSLVDES